MPSIKPELLARKVWRVQDKFGRGPYRPGFSHKWSDAQGPIVPLWWDEIGVSFSDAHGAMDESWHNGCGFQSPQKMRAWFSKSERRKLARLGYYLTEMYTSVIYAETPTQIVFGRLTPLCRPDKWVKLSSKIADTANDS